LYFHEAMPPGRFAGFVLVWIALAVFTVEALSHSRRQLRLAALPRPSDRPTWPRQVRPLVTAER